MTSKMFTDRAEEELLRFPFLFLVPVLHPKAPPINFIGRFTAVGTSLIAAAMTWALLTLVCGLLRPTELLVRHWLPAWMFGRAQ